MQKIRSSTQIFDDNHLLLQKRDLERIYTAVLSQPESDEYLVYTLQRGDDGGWIIDWDDTQGQTGTIPPGGGENTVP